MKTKLTTVSAAIAVALGAAAVPQTASALVVEFDMDAFFTIFQPDGVPFANASVTGKGVNTFHTPLTGTITFDTATGSGGGTVDPFLFFGNASQPAIAKDISMQAIGDGFGNPGTLVLGNMLFDWGGSYNIPVSLVMDAAGMFGGLPGAIGGGLTSTISGVGAIPAADGNFTNAIHGYMNLGPTPIATTTFNTTNVAGCVTSTCTGMNPSGTLPIITDTFAIVPPAYNSLRSTGIAGSPMQDGPFTNFNAAFDITSLTLTNVVVPVPAAVWLFGSGLLGLVGVARRKKQA